MPKDSSVAIDVVGLRDFQRELRSLDKTFPREMRVANKKAAEPIADDTRASFSSRGGVAPKVAPSVKVKAQQREASISIGGDKYPYAMGAEFGGGLHGAGNPTSGGGYTTQFPPHRGNGAGAGYSLYPSIRKNKEKVVNIYGDLIDDLAKASFPD
jgi:hypothetical protein